MARYVETSVRIWWLWLLPILLPLIAGGVVYKFRSPEYDAQMTIWVEKATYLDLPDDGSPWITPAQAQANLLTELVQTRTFLMRVAEQTDLGVYTTTEAGQTYLEEYFSKRLGIQARGTHAVDVTFRTDQPALGVAALNAVVNVFTDHITTSAREQAKIAYDFYSRQLPDREREFVAANAAVRDFLARYTPAVTGEPTTAARLLEENELAELRRRQDLARKRYEDTIAALERIQLQAGASDTARERGFRVLDPPAVPTRPAGGRKELLLAVGLGFGGALALCLGLTVALTWLDPTARTAAAAQRRLGLPVLATIAITRPRRRRAAQPVPRRLALGPALGGSER